jgi:RNA polymerase sigma-70 factor (ECF subfamily)
MNQRLETGSKQSIDIHECYIRYGPMVLRRCRGMLKDEDRAFDSMQEVFEKLLLNGERLNVIAMSSYLYRMATNLCLNKIRADRNHQALAEEIVRRIPHTEAGREYGGDARNLLEYILRGGEKLNHRVAVMYFVDGMTLTEIAAEIGKSVPAVYKRLLKVLRLLKKEGGEEWKI